MTEIHVKLGKLLQMERERRQLTLADMAQELKITESNLEHIENGNVAGLPGELFFNLFAKSYAEALGIDYTKTVEAIREDIGEPVDTPAEGELATSESVAEHKGREELKPIVRPEISSPGSQTRQKLSPISIIAVVMIAAVMVLAWYLFKDQTRVSLLEKGKQVLHAFHVDTAGNEEAITQAIPANLNLKLKARDRCWATVLADGDTALAMNLKPQRDYSVGAQDRLLISLSEPLAVDVIVNGKRLDLTDPEKGTVEKVIVTLSNMNLFIKEPVADSLRADSGLITPTESEADDSSAAMNGTPITTKPIAPKPDSLKKMMPKRDSLLKPRDSVLGAPKR